MSGTNGPDYYEGFIFWIVENAGTGYRTGWINRFKVESLEGIYADDLVYINGIEVIEADSGIINAELNLQVRNQVNNIGRVHTEDQTKVSDSDYIGFDKIVEFKEERLSNS